MATYFHQHHHHHHNHHGNTSDIIPQQADGGLQTLILMNPNLVGYSEPHAPSPSSPSPSPTSNFLFHAPTLYHAPPPLLPQLVGVPLHHSADPYQPPPSSHAQQHYAAWAHLGHMPPERDSPRAQQGLSLTLASSQNHSFTRADHAEPDHFHPSPPAVPTPPGCRSESPTATAASAGDVAALMTPSKYLKAAQELLEEVVNVTVDRVKPESGKMIKTKGESPPAADSVAGDGLNEERPAHELTPSEKHELQMKKAKLITLLDEVEQRQRQYHQQMQEVVGSFEQVAGSNSARTYTSLALKTISNQFRSLRGAISGQIRATNKALGEGEGEGGSTSRLRMLDHQMRQQRALQQLGMIQNNAWRPQRGLPEKAVSVLRAWLFEHFLHPYPKDSDKIMLAKRTGLTRSQVSNWFINARVRLWKPMIEEMYAEEVKEQQQQNGSDGKSSSRQDHHTAAGDDDQAKDAAAAAAENHSSSIVGSTVSIPPFGSNPENPFALVDSGAHQGSSCGLKKQRMNNTDHFLSTATFPDSDLFNSGCKEEERHNHKQEDCSMMQGPSPGFMGGLVSYPIGEIGQFPANFSGNNGVSLTLGLPHCDSLSLQGNNNRHNQAFLHSSQDMDQYRGRLEMSQLSGFGGVKPPNPSQNAYAAQLLHDFVA